ncbi:MAG: Rrf2 family transcriptional regulator [Planctomycetes bacterium]|nr:Rrf2 family transcriptional regulator [Planctomycetota bacterium]
MLNQTTEYALSALSALAAYPRGSRVTRRELAERAGVPADYLAKIMWTLVRIGVLSGRKGAGGGFGITAEGERRPLADVVGAFENQSRAGRCILRRAACGGESTCLLHHRWERVLLAMDEFLAGTRVEDLRVPAPPGRVGGAAGRGQTTASGSSRARTVTSGGRRVRR